MWNNLYLTLSLFFLLFLSYTDLKDRTAPPELTYGLLFLGIALHGLQSFIEYNIEPIAFSLFGVLIMFLLSYAIYRAGGWAGGDVKLFTALGAVIPFYGTLSQLTFPLPFPILILASSTISILPFVVIYGSWKVLKEDAQSLKKDIVSSIPKSIYSAFVLIASLHLAKILGINPASALIIAPLIYISKEPGYPLTAFLSTLSLLNYTASSLQNLLYFLILSVLVVTGIKTYSSIKQNVLREEKNIEDLEEGDIPAQDVWRKEGELEKKEPDIFRFREEGKLVVDSRRARGFIQDELDLLKGGEINKLGIKKSLPFIPLLALGFILLLVLENFL